MTEQTKKRIGAIISIIAELDRDCSGLKQRLAEMEAQRAKLAAERWQLILTP